MPVFTTLVANILPLYLLIAMGYAAGRWHAADRKSVAAILFYFITPVVFFSSIMKTRMDGAVLALPLITYLIASALCLLAYAAARAFWQDDTRNLLALSAGTANTGYFGLPVALLLFDAQGVGIYMAAMLGVSLFEASLGFFMIARGRHTGREALRKLMRLPPLYAFLLGVLASKLNLTAPPPLENLFTAMRGAYIVTGMMIIGLGLAAMPRFRFDLRFTAFGFVMKFIAWPAAAALTVMLDNAAGNLLGAPAHRALLLLSFMPLAANSVVYATLLDIKPEKMAGSVLLGTLFALLYVPLMAGWFLAP